MIILTTSFIISWPSQ